MPVLPLDNNPIVRRLSEILNNPVELEKLREAGRTLEACRGALDDDPVTKAAAALSDVLGPNFPISMRDLGGRSFATMLVFCNSTDEMVLRRARVVKERINAISACLAWQSSQDAWHIFTDTRFIEDYVVDDPRLSYPEVFYLVVSEYVDKPSVITKRAELEEDGASKEKIRHFAYHETLQAARHLRLMMEEIGVVMTDLKPGNLFEDGKLSDLKSIVLLSDAEYSSQDGTINCGAMRGSLTTATSQYIPSIFNVNGGRQKLEKVIVRQLFWTLYELLTGNFDDGRLDGDKEPSYSNPFLSQRDCALLKKLFKEESLRAVLTLMQNPLYPDEKINRSPIVPKSGSQKFQQSKIAFLAPPVVSTPLFSRGMFGRRRADTTQSASTLPSMTTPPSSPPATLSSVIPVQVPAAVTVDNADLSAILSPRSKAADDAASNPLLQKGMDRLTLMANSPEAAAQRRKIQEERRLQKALLSSSSQLGNRPDSGSG